MRISYDDQLLFSVGADGSLFAFKVTDKEGRGFKREKDITYAEEVLVTKSDLDDKVQVGNVLHACSLKVQSLHVWYIAATTYFTMSFNCYCKCVPRL